ncbi:MAG TPA: DUF2252 family protein [Phenylobacterium sp.]|jgi:uncharacterized protein (DUF2252 family)|uniref:DUF2252 family protein n=1 Tax=Phenylobacterium sp. TaxID=1871053 RepID=UPI002D70D8A3|nr:DUF2252 family protein [Phenylobacterium sp.]HZZ69268.1 DUF2252 family protein [Phenylobacterium sp.]
MAKLRLPAPDERAALLRDAQRMKMTRSAHAYVRGSTAKFYEWLQASGGKIPQGPSVWICGDCHSGNLGPVASAGGEVAVQIRDLDQTVIGNPAHDLIRLGLSLATAARGSNLPGVTTALMVERLVEGYEAGLAGETLAPDEDTAPKEVRRVLKRSLHRRWKDLARERIIDPRPTIPLGKRFWPLSEAERAALEGLAADEGLRKLVTGLRHRPGDAPIAVLDGAYWMKGCSSLGRLRYALLVGVAGDGGGTETVLIDIKEATPAAAPSAPGAKMPADNARRVVAGARALSPFLGRRMLAGKLNRRPVVIRELTPQDLKLDIEHLSREEALRAAHYLALVVGRAHARQMDPDTKAAWRAELARNRATKLDAPFWLWSAIVELIQSHEAAYLDHCRRYALQPGAA